MVYKTSALLNRVGTYELAKATGILAVSISKWKNSRSLPSPQFFAALAAATNLTIDDYAQATTEDKAMRIEAKRAAQAVVNGSRVRPRSAKALNAKGRTANAAQASI